MLLTKEQFGVWRQHPVTREVLRALTIYKDWHLDGYRNQLDTENVLGSMARIANLEGFVAALETVIELSYDGDGTRENLGILGIYKHLEGLDLEEDDEERNED